jgi:hypothetical protein
MSEPLLNIRNHHAASCGDPPIIACDAAHCYIGYFENRYGEQWIFTRDRETGQATLRGGDVGWNTDFNVVDGKVLDLLLGKDEQLWLRACWEASQWVTGS